MRLTRQGLATVLAGLAVAAVVLAVAVVAVAAWQGWWEVAVLVLAVLQAVTLLLLLQLRGTTRHGAVHDLHELVDQVGSRVLEVTEKNRLDTNDRLDALAHRLDADGASVTTAEGGRARP